MTKIRVKKDTAKNVKAIALAMAITVLPLQGAHAGFEWTPPPMATKQSMPPVAAAPAGSVEAEPLINPNPMSGEPVPMPGEDTMMEPAPMARLDRANVAPLSSSASAFPAAAMKVSSPYMPVTPAAPVMKQDFSVVEGFGNDIPLALAMRQIVPDGYSYSFDKDVNPGMRISWNGGKPWNQVLEDAIRPQDLRVMINGENVWVRQTWKNGEEAMMDAATAPKPMAPMPPMEFTPMAPMQAAAAPVPVQPAAPAVMPAPEMQSHTASDEMMPQSYPPRQKPDLSQDQMREMDEEVIFNNPRVAATMPVMAAPYAPAAPAVIGGPQPIPLTPGSQMAAAPAMAPPPVMAGAAVPVMDPVDIGYWQAAPGESLRGVLTRWAQQGRVQLVWNSAYDYMLPTPVGMHGTFADAVTEVLTAYSMQDPRPVGQLHPNLPAGPSVLVIENFTAATN